MNYSNKNKPWTDKQRKFIMDNYLVMNNEQLGEKLGRTEDSVRKEFKKLGLKRPKKSTSIKVSKKRGRRKKILTVFEALKQGHEKKIKLDRAKKLEETRKSNEQKRIANEALWATNFLGDKEKIRECKTLINPIKIEVPSYKVEFNIDRNQEKRKIVKKIAAIKNKYSNEEVIIKNYN